MTSPADGGTFDYVIVGGGTAGCVLANRLSADPTRSVALIEAGGSDWNPMLHIPSASGKLLRRGLHGWKYHTEPDAGLGGRSLFWPRGRVLGGSSSINGMVYIRGHASDYDRWAQAGNRGWSFEDVLPYFLRSEGHTERNGRLHGRDGELKLTRGSLPNPLFDAFVEAGVQAGFPRRDDFNGPEQEGFGRFDFNIAGGRRQSAAVAFLRPVRRRGNLRVIKRAQATGLTIEGGRATGVRCRRGGSDLLVRARAEVILCAGVIGSPQLLMLSGIGPGGHLAEHGIAVARDAPGVGSNLQDHGQVGLLFGCRQPLTMHQLIRADRAALHLLRAALLRDGPFAQFPTQGGAFTRTRPELAAPDVQWHFGNFLGVDRIRVPHPFHRPGPLERDGYTIGVCLLRPESRGEIRLRSADPLANPVIRPNYLSSPRDMDVMVAAFHQARRVAGMPALAPFSDGELRPGDAVQDEDAIRAWIRSAFATVHHQVGTCRMGQDAGAVVDERLRVRGIDGLRVADASIMPSIVGGNTHAPVIMIAEKAAEMAMADRGP